MTAACGTVEFIREEQPPSHSEEHIMTQMIRQFVITLCGNEDDVKAVSDSELESVLQNDPTFAGFDGGVTVSLSDEHVQKGETWVSTF